MGQHELVDPYDMHIRLQYLTEINDELINQQERELIKWCQSFTEQNEHEIDRYASKITHDKVIVLNHSMVNQKKKNGVSHKTITQKSPLEIGYYKVFYICPQDMRRLAN